MNCKRFCDKFCFKNHFHKNLKFTENSCFKTPKKSWYFVIEEHLSPCISYPCVKSILHNTQCPGMQNIILYQLFSRIFHYHFDTLILCSLALFPGNKHLGYLENKSDLCNILKKPSKRKRTKTVVKHGKEKLKRKIVEVVLNNS